MTQIGLHVRRLIVLVAVAAAADGIAGDNGDVTRVDTNMAPASLNLGFHDQKRIAAALAAIDQDHTIEMECQTVAPDASKPIRHIIRLTPLNKAGKPDGREQVFVDWYRRAARITEYVNGMRQGMERQFDVQTGNVLSETSWDQDVIEGIKKTFHPDGTLANETPYKKGVVAGQSRSYSSEGVLVRVVNFKDGKRDGESVDYWPEKPEAVQRTISYRNGLVEGVAKAFYLNGALKWERPFRDNLQHGVEKQYAADGLVEKTIYWFKGNAVSEDDYRRLNGK
jgi:antitoxin component YwqK of YwqJK toxin-antitoxin module